VMNLPLTTEVTHARGMILILMDAALMMMQISQLALNAVLVVVETLLEDLPNALVMNLPLTTEATHAHGMMLIHKPAEVMMILISLLTLNAVHVEVVHTKALLLEEEAPA
jgi:hypothetical protein